MFESRVWREKAVPVPCRVSISKALPHLARGSTRADKLPLWLRAGGVRLEDEMDAELLRWARLNDGQWLGCIRIRPTIGDAITSMTMWVTADAIAAWPTPNRTQGRPGVGRP